MMRRLRFIARIIAGGACWLPLLADGHGAEFLDARFEARNGLLHLQIIADYGDNPMLANETEARKALSDALRIELASSKTQHRLDELAPLKITPRVERDAQSPVPKSGDHAEHAHHLLAASWRWAAPEGEVRFLVPETSHQTVLFWLHEPGVSPPRWSMLVPGDRTPAIVVKRPWWRQSWLWGAIIGTAILAAATAIRLPRRRHIPR